MSYGRGLALLLMAVFASGVEVVTYTATEHPSGTNSHLLLGSASAI